ncbi:MAG: hypothetical protein WDW36_005725 [Sanguina aurantia]
MSGELLASSAPGAASGGTPGAGLGYLTPGVTAAWVCTTEKTKGSCHSRHAGGRCSDADPTTCEALSERELQDVSLLLHEPVPVGHLERGWRLRWGERLEATQATLSTQEPLLSLRRQLSETLGDSAQAGDCWLQQVKLCRTTGHHEASAPAVLEALFRSVPGAVGEHGKLLWNTGNQRRAIEELQAAQKRWRDPKTHSRPGGGPGGEGRAGGVSVRERAKVAVQLCGWVQGQGQLGYLELRGLFEGVLKLEPTWEKGHFHFARFLDHTYCDAKRRQTQPKEKGAGSRHVARGVTVEPCRSGFAVHHQ